MQHQSSPFRITKRVEGIFKEISEIVVPLHGDKFHPFRCLRRIVYATSDRCTSKGKVFLICIYLYPGYQHEYLNICGFYGHSQNPFDQFSHFDCLPRETRWFIQSLTKSVREFQIFTQDRSFSWKSALRWERVDEVLWANLTLRARVTLQP